MVTFSLTKQAKEAAEQGYLRELLMVTKKLSRKFQRTDKRVKDKNGKPIITSKEQLKRWLKHFKDLLDTCRLTQERPLDIQSDATYRSD